MARQCDVSVQNWLSCVTKCPLKTRAVEPMVSSLLRSTAPSQALPHLQSSGRPAPSRALHQTGRREESACLLPKTHSETLLRERLGERQAQRQNAKCGKRAWMRRSFAPLMAKTPNTNLAAYRYP